MLLECINLTHTYPGSDTPVIKGLSFSMKTAGFKALFGPSGVGKTTLAKLIANQNRSGEVPITTKNLATLLYTYNLERLPGWSSIGRHLTRVTPSGKTDLKERLVDSFGLKRFMGTRFSKLSMGQQNRVNLIRYLLQEFDGLILDESLANVDEKLRETIILEIKALFPGKLFLYISHNLMEVSKFCSDILVFSDPSDNRGYTMVQGLDMAGHASPNKKKLDAVMLEIMNAF